MRFRGNASSGQTRIAHRRQRRLGVDADRVALFIAFLRDGERAAGKPSRRCVIVGQIALRTCALDQRLRFGRIRERPPHGVDIMKNAPFDVRRPRERSRAALGIRIMPGRVVEKLERVSEVAIGVRVLRVLQRVGRCNAAQKRDDENPTHAIKIPEREQRRLE